MAYINVIHLFINNNYVLKCVFISASILYCRIFANPRSSFDDQRSEMYNMSEWEHISSV